MVGAKVVFGEIFPEKMVKLSGKYLDLWKSIFNEYKGISFIDNRNQEGDSEGQHQTGGAKNKVKKSKLTKSKNKH